MVCTHTAVSIYWKNVNLLFSKFKTFQLRKNNEVVEITYPSSFPIFIQEGFPTVTPARIQFPHNGVFCNEMLIIYKTLF